MKEYVIAYDIGTTGVKTCIYSLEERITYQGGKSQSYPLYTKDNGGVEQDPMDWWKAMCETTKALLEEKKLSKEQVKAISFCAQMQGVVLVDREGMPLYNAMSYMDNRGHVQKRKGLERGIKISGLNGYKMIKSIAISGGVSASVKDPVWKYRWIADNEPEIFEKVDKWLDVKDYLVCHCTGNKTMSYDSAFATLLYDYRKQVFSEKLCQMFQVKKEHLPPLCHSDECVGTLKKERGEELGLSEETFVFSGGGDASLIGLGAGNMKKGETHIYMGTSGWVSTVMDKQITKISNRMASIVGVEKDMYHCFAELETAGKCLQWAKENIGQLGDKPLKEASYEDLMEAIDHVPAGSNKVIFTPWLHGNRCPFEDPHARGEFFNIGLETTGEDLLHSVLEGVCFHLKWQLLEMNSCTKTSNTIRFVGGGALSPLLAQILADITERKVETVENPQDVGAFGAAILMAKGLGKISIFEEGKESIVIKDTYYPRRENRKTYRNHFQVFKRLYRDNRKAFNQLNQ